MADSLKEAARDLDKALTAVNRAVEQYVAAAVAAGREASDGPVYRGLDTTQLRRKISAFIVARLSPKRGIEKPFLHFDGAPEARKYVQAHGLPGL